MTDNELIARFMGADSVVPEKDFLAYDNEVSDKTIILETLKYNTSFDWLMPVVEKIEGVIGEGAHFMIGTNITFIMWVHNADTQKIEGKGTNKIEAVYNVAVEFIKWYNQNN